MKKEETKKKKPVSTKHKPERAAARTVATAPKRAPKSEHKKAAKPAPAAKFREKERPAAAVVEKTKIRVGKPIPKPAAGVQDHAAPEKVVVQKREAAQETKAAPVPARPKTEAPKAAPQASVTPKAEPPKVAAPAKAAPPVPEAPMPAVKVREVPKAVDAPGAPETPAIPAAPAAPEKPAPRVLLVSTPVMLKDLAHLMGIKANAIIAHLMDKNIFANINQSLGEDIVKGVLAAYGFEYGPPPLVDARVAEKKSELEDRMLDLTGRVPRAPVVTFMGHVDHGKTSLLDFIRKAHVADKEKGGITQHIGAYRVKYRNGSITFLDTPGHEAFTAMRARGANATDVVVLVIAADDGIMPQTREAIDHARAAGVPIVVAVNKCDLPTANIDKVKSQLAQVDLHPEDWGGKTITVAVSAKTGEGVDHLLEMLLLEAELLELKANPKIRARGVVIEGKLSSEQGPIATVLVKNGTLRVGDLVVSGMHYGRVKAMLSDTLGRIREAPPSMPVTILGLTGVPMAGDEFFVVKDEKKARTLCLLKQDEARERKLRLSKRVTLEDFYKRVQDGETKELRMILKGDVQGSVEALQRSLDQLSTKEVKLNIIHIGVGNVSESDVMLAVVSNCVMLGFNVRIDPEAEEAAGKEDVEIKLYDIIYEAIADVHAAMEGLLEPVSKEVFVGRAQVRQVFRVSKVGTIAGSFVLKGKIVRTGIARLVRDKEVAYQGKIASLKRFKDDAREVNEGFECGIGLDRHDDIKEGDLIEVYQIVKVARRLTK